jgi:hypothetical protein
MKDVLIAPYADAQTLVTTAQPWMQTTRVYALLWRRMARCVAGSFQEDDGRGCIERQQLQYSVCLRAQRNKSRREGSILVTDATPGSSTKNIEVCPSFWTGPSAKYLLYNSEKTSPRPPYRDNDGNGWCAKDSDNSKQTNQHFATAATTVLHELTHLDSLGAKVGLKDEDGQQGTDDFQAGCELDGARDYPADYRKNQDDDMPSPDYNAESYAAVTEIYSWNYVSPMRSSR